MRLFLDFQQGPLQGKKVNIYETASLGRKGAKIEIPDPKLSGIHCYFEFNESRGWMVVDNQSRNGVWVNGFREKNVILKDGDRVAIGSTLMICRLIKPSKFEFSTKFKVWAQSLLKRVGNQQKPLREIKPEVRLEVIQGIQYGECWDVFYGPRRAGLNSSDICLYDDEAPEDSFEIRVKGKYAYFYTNHSNEVKLNDVSVKEKQLTPGDVISIGQSRIIVKVDEGHGFDS